MINLSQRYGRSKGVRAPRLEEPPLGNLAPHDDLEESASHHIVFVPKAAASSLGALLAASGKPSTWFPLGGPVEQAYQGKTKRKS